MLDNTGKWIKQVSQLGQQKTTTFREITYQFDLLLEGMTWILHTLSSCTVLHPFDDGLLHWQGIPEEPLHNTQQFCYSLVLFPEANKLKIKKDRKNNKKWMFERRQNSFSKFIHVLISNLIKISCSIYATAMNIDVHSGSVYWTADFNQIVLNS